MPYRRFDAYGGTLYLTASSVRTGDAVIAVSFCLYFYQFAAGSASCGSAEVIGVLT
jgi:hypothetical protein